MSYEYDPPINVAMALYILKPFGISNRETARRYIAKANEPVFKENEVRIRNGNEPIILTKGMTIASRFEKVKNELSEPYILKKIREYEKAHQ